MKSENIFFNLLFLVFISSFISLFVSKITGQTELKIPFVQHEYVACQKLNTNNSQEFMHECLMKNDQDYRTRYETATKEICLQLKNAKDTNSKNWEEIKKKYRPESLKNCGIF